LSAFEVNFFGFGELSFEVIPTLFEVVIKNKVSDAGVLVVNEEVSFAVFVSSKFDLGIGDDDLGLIY
jgi:hypothetical protein